MDFLHPVADVPYALITYVKEDLTGGPLNIFKMVEYIALYLVENHVIKCNSLNFLKASYMAALVLLCLCSSLATVIYLFDTSWKTDPGELVVLSLGSFISQGMESCHLFGLSKRV